MKNERTHCPACKKGHVVWNGPSDNYYFTCSRCEWETGRGGEIPANGLKGLVGIAIYGGKIIVPKPKAQPKKKHAKREEFQPDSPELVQAIRAETQRRADLCAAERKKFPPTNILKKGKLVPNPKFTEKMRKHMHTFAYSAEEIRAELIAGGMK